LRLQLLSCGDVDGDDAQSDPDFTGCYGVEVRQPNTTVLTTALNLLTEDSVPAVENAPVDRL